MRDPPQELYDNTKNEGGKEESSIKQAGQIRGLFMNEHISKEEYLLNQEKKRKMKEILEFFLLFD